MQGQPADALNFIPVLANEHNFAALIEPQKAFLEESFPDVESAFLVLKLNEGWSLNRICEYIWANNNIIPRKKILKPPTPHRRLVTVAKTPSIKSPIKKTAIDYFVIDDNRATYFDESLSVLEQNFKKVGIRSLRSILMAHDGHFAPTFRAITEALNYATTKRKKIITATSPKGTVPLTILVRQRVLRKVDFGKLPKALRKEIRWTKDALKEYLSDSLQNLTINADDSLIEEISETNSLECPICYVEYETSKILTCVDGHLICHDCLSSHIKETIYGQNKADILCAEVSCNAKYTREAVESVSDDEMLKKYDERVMEENLALADITNLVRCRFCNFGVIIDVSIQVNKVFKCGNPRCGKEICRRCNIDWQKHIGIPCDEIETDADEKFRKQAEERLANVVIRHCHRCRVPIVKEAGCNKMECRCGAKMCYLCRQPDIDYDHFCRHPLSPPQKKCRHCTACKLHDDAEAIDKENLNALVREVHEEQKVLLGMPQTRRAHLNRKQQGRLRPIIKGLKSIDRNLEATDIDEESWVWY